ncbi:MAG: tRNA (adenosine(37)-N6)-dimethylallyltransferase MiaA, partial [Tepidisphaeraceae bacterium]
PLRSPFLLFAAMDEMTAAPRIFAIIGPTASGKSDLAMALARRVGGEILSVDSMQVYRGMDVGTAKPSAQEQRDVRHHLIDVVDPDQPFTAARFVEMADGVMADARKRHVPLIAVGGTPLYFKVLFEGMFDGPGADETVRARLRALSNEELHRRVTEGDPAAAARIHQNDTRRLVRALEVLELTGKPISSLQNEWDAPQARHAATWIGLSWDREMLNRRINARVKAMMAAGWIEEVRALLSRYGTLSKTAAEATGYAELIAHVEGKLSLDDAAEKLKIATRQLARRQMKWFKRFPEVLWLPGESPVDEKLSRLAIV